MTLEDDADWWRQAVVYQVYPRSFADANGDGIGDLRGIRSRVPYLRRLGVDAVWLSPFYPSALADGGYDVDDYRDVDPRLGTLDDFDDLVGELHAAGIRIVVDIVPNHTSNRHEWFVEALASPRGSAARDRYIFRDGLGEGGSMPPADWTSAFGGPAWEPVGDGQWYLHYFATEQPDLNWDDREVRDDFLRTLRFWSDRGVDGFRIDVAHGLAKLLDDELPDQAALDALPRDGGHPLWDRDEVHAIYAEWRAVFDSYSPPRTAVAEAWVDTSRRPRYASREGLGQAFNFDLLEAPFDAAAFRRVVDANLALAAQSGSSTTWVLSNHDVVRHATRYGLPEPADPSEKQGAAWLLSGGLDPMLDAERGLRRARAATLFMLGLPGFGLPLPGRGARAPRGRRHPAERTAGPGVLPQSGRRRRPRRMPRAHPMAQRRHVVRVRRRRRAPSPARLVRRARRGGPGGRPRLDAGAVPASARGAQGAPGTRAAGVAGDGARRGRAVPTRRRVGGRHQLRGFAGPDARRRGARRERPRSQRGASRGDGGLAPRVAAGLSRRHPPTRHPGDHPADGRARARMRSRTNSPGLIGAKPTSTTSSPASRSRCVIVSRSHRTKYASRGE